jgi:hypothetical protein
MILGQDVNQFDDLEEEHQYKIVEELDDPIETFEAAMHNKQYELALLIIQLREAELSEHTIMKLLHQYHEPSNLFHLFLESLPTPVVMKGCKQCKHAVGHPLPKKRKTKSSEGVTESCEADQDSSFAASSE